MSPDVAVFSDHIDGQARLCVVVKRRYRLWGARLEVAAEPSAIATTPVLATPGSAAEPGRMLEDSDLLCPRKPFTDVLLRGHAHSARGPARELVAAVRVGSARKQVRVTGDRTVELGPSGRATFSQPRPFVSFPLQWEHAYGGVDAIASAGSRHPLLAGRDGARNRADRPLREAAASWIRYPRNRWGRGFVVAPGLERLRGTLAPNLDDPNDPVSPARLLTADPAAWTHLPTAACFEPIDWFSFPRSLFGIPPPFAPPSAQLPEERAQAISANDLLAPPLLRVPAHPRFYNCAPAGLSGTRLQGNERVSLWNLHPSRALLELDLPAERPRLLLEPPGCGVFELPPLLQTVLIEPGQERVTLTWAGTLQVAAPYPDETCAAMRRAIQWER